MLQSTDGGSTVSSTEKRLKKLEEVSARRASRPFEMSWDTSPANPQQSPHTTQRVTLPPYNPPTTSPYYAESYPAPLQPSNNLPILR